MNVTSLPSALVDVLRHNNNSNSSLSPRSLSSSSPGWALIHTATLTSCSLLLIVIFCLGSYGNLVVFLSFFDPAFRKFRTNFDFMILNLSLCDMIICCVMAPMFALVLFLDSRGGSVSNTFCFTFHLTSSAFIIMSLETVAVIALHRLRMVLGQQPNRMASLPCTLALTALLWTSSFTIAALLTLRAYPTKEGPCLPHFGLTGGRARVVLYVYLADFAFCVAVVSVCYLMIAQTLRKNAQVRKCRIIAVDATRPSLPPPRLIAAGLEGMQCAVQVPSLYRNQTYNKLQHIQTHSYTTRPTSQGLVPGAAQGANRPTSQGLVPGAAQGANRPTSQGLVPGAAQGANRPTSQGLVPGAAQGANRPTSQGLVPGAAQGATCCQLVSTINLATVKDSKAVVTCVVIVFSVLLCCLPMGVSLAQDVLSLESSFAHYQFELCGFALIFLKSCINPFVYSRNSAGLRRRILCCLQWVALVFLCCKHKTLLHAMGKGSLEVNRNKSSHHETNSAYVLSPKPQKRLVHQACGPSHSRDCAPSPRAMGGHGGRKPRPPSTSTPIDTCIEPYYSIYNSSPSAGPSTPINSLQPATNSSSSQAFGFAKSYIPMHYHIHQEVLQDVESTSTHKIPIPSV